MFTPIDQKKFKDILNPTITTISSYLVSAEAGELREYEFPDIANLADELDCVVLKVTQLNNVTRFLYQTDQSIDLALHLEAGFPRTIYKNLTAAEIRQHCVDRIEYLCKLADEDPIFIYGKE